MNRLIFIPIFLLLFNCKEYPATNPVTTIDENLATTLVDSIPYLLQKIITAYPSQPFRASANYLIWNNQDSFLFDDKQQKNFEKLLNQPDLEDQMYLVYTPTIPVDTPPRNYDPGRIRVESFFKIMYGKTKKEVQKNLTTISFCGQQIQVTTVNEVDKQLLKINQELRPHLKQWSKYLQNIGGSFNWRTIAGTNRMSMHSFGMTIDINIKYADYWRWNVADKSENGKRKIYYKNKIPLELVALFEKHGFIWGGRWYHYDTMHFEYRPELLQ